MVPEIATEPLILRNMCRADAGDPVIWMARDAVER
jgi:hypothetical protein